jgi:hypothetical protein
MKHTLPSIKITIGERDRGWVTMEFAFRETTGLVQVEQNKSGLASFKMSLSRDCIKNTNPGSSRMFTDQD